MPVATDVTDDHFAEDETLGNEEPAQAQNVQAQPVIETAHQPVTEAEQQENTSASK